MTTKNAGVWLRVSTSEQASENQRPDVDHFAAHHGYTVTATYELRDSAWNGGKDGGDYKAALQQALDDAWAGKFSVLIIWALDRITREGAEGALKVIRQFRERGCTIVSVKESWLNGSPEVQDVLVAFAGWMAQQESQRRSERVKAGLARKQRDNPEFRPGRQPGAKDKAGRPRRRSGYVAAWEPGGARREQQGRA
jgi:DNA invertase Pin-like site-specific DNA recombinase